MICDLDVPVLFVDGPVKRDGYSLPADQLYMDNTTEITRFVNIMLAAGKTRIGFVGNYNHCQSFYERYTAFEEIIESIADLEELPEVFICANDFIAGDLVRDLFSIGKSVPEDVLILGFDNSPESRYFRPALSTVHIHTQVMAFAAMQLLISRRHEPSLDARIVHTETELILRDSTRLN